MSDTQFLILRGEVAFWALLVLASTWDGVWWRLFASLLALAMWFGVKRLEREPGQGFWQSLWK